MQNWANSRERLNFRLTLLWVLTMYHPLSCNTGSYPTEAIGPPLWLSRGKGFKLLCPPIPVSHHLSDSYFYSRTLSVASLMLIS
jgi:hypothetical protein